MTPTYIVKQRKLGNFSNLKEKEKFETDLQFGVNDFCVIFEVKKTKGLKPLC